MRSTKIDNIIKRISILSDEELAIFIIEHTSQFLIEEGKSSDGKTLPVPLLVNSCLIALDVMVGDNVIAKEKAITLVEIIIKKITSHDI